IDQLYVSNGINVKCGVAIWLKKDKVTNIQQTFKDNEGRMLVIDCVYKLTNLRIINIYAPNLEKERKAFFKYLQPWCTLNTLVFGEFNTVQTTMDISANNVFRTDTSRSVLQHLIRDNIAGKRSWSSR
uniref:Uncharacterized protein n=1 Tax=Sander lucioperca TaxID=283035 RepID=A0A8C9ZRU1_SANLU